jgi:hypothetical protein
MTTDQKGAIAETAIAHAATKLGIDVYTPIAEGGRYDLILDLGCQLVSCESSRRTAEGFIRRCYTTDEVDAIAAYSLEFDRCFLIPIARIANRPAIAFRVLPCRNNQRRVNWADDCDFAVRLGDHQGAVAQLGERLAGSQ